MNIVWLTWKDTKHPLAGGAEIVNEELARRLVNDGHAVKFLVGGIKGSKPSDQNNGFEVTRLGGRVSVYFKTWRYYKKHRLDKWADLVIDEVNTVPFFARFYTKKSTILFIHQLCRKVWFYELPKPIGAIGYILEPIYLRMLNKCKVITVSESTKKDLLRHGFNTNNISIISEGIQLEPAATLHSISKYSKPTMLSFGAIKPMKRTMHQLRAFEIAKKAIPSLQLKIAGSAKGKYGKKVLKAISISPYRADIEYLGKVSQDKKVELMQKCHLIIVTSVKEGWALVVTEAASQGTPAVVYNVDGLRDSVQNNQTGCIVSSNTLQVLADKITSVIGDQEIYQNLRRKGWQWSKQITIDQSYTDFKKAAGL